MKKLLLVLLTVFALTACSTKTTMVSNADEGLITGNGVNYTEQDYFESMKNNDYSGIVVSSLVNKIAVLENIDLSTIEEDINKDLEEMKTSYGDSYETIINYYGGEEYFKNTMLSSLISSKLAENYFDTKYDVYKESYKPKLGKVVYFDTLEAAQTTIDAIKAGKTFEMAAAENGYGSEIKEEVFTDKSELSVEVKGFLNSITEPTLSNVILTTITSTLADGTTSNTNRYYVVEVSKTNADDFKDLFIETLATLVESTEILNHYFEKYDIEVYDQRTYELLSSMYEGIK